MAFFLHGLTGHEAMPMNRLFEKRPVNKTEQVFAYHGLDKHDMNTSEETVSQNREHAQQAQNYYESIEHTGDNIAAVIAADIMISPVMVLTPRATLSKAITLFRRRNFRHVPVVIDDKQLIGMVSDRDILGYLSQHTDNKEPFRELQDVEKVMQTNVVSASRDTDIRYIARLFVEDRIGAMPIVENGKLIGIITRSDILRAVMQNFHIGLWV